MDFGIIISNYKILGNVFTSFHKRLKLRVYISAIGWNICKGDRLAYKNIVHMLVLKLLTSYFVNNSCALVGLT
jgi:hypothetical protein